MTWCQIQFLSPITTVLTQEMDSPQDQEVEKSSTKTYHITGRWETLVDQRLHRHPLDRPILIVTKAVVVVGKQVTGQRIISY